TAYLNFEAVDQCCTVYMNGLLAGSHEGGYIPFSLDVSHLIKEDNEILVKVTDDSDSGIYAYGKQKIDHGGMWYTPSSGIWQTVWLEELPEHAVQDIKISIDFDHGTVYVQMDGTFSQSVIAIYEGKTQISSTMTGDKTCSIALEHPHPWTPEDPFIYDMYIRTEDETVHTYFGMRKFSKARDSRGIMRFMLNNKPIFLTGLLDQGYTIDGLMTYPTNDAMKYDILKMKKLGFNMIRKHVKVENRRWYAMCDHYGMLVMQDMPNGGGPYDMKRVAVWPTLGIRKASDKDYEKNGRGSIKGRKAYYMELDGMLDMLYNSVSVFAWVPFNEGWGQFDTKEAVERIRSYDSTRLIDAASGWFETGEGDFDSRHVYFRHFHVPAKNDDRILLLSEFGGYSFLDKKHSEAKELYGYKKFTDRLQWSDAVLKLFDADVLQHVKEGLSGSVYTQTADIEDECNGLMTADRRLTKIDEKRMRIMNQRIKRSLK
ncbi:MAG: glycoside hydrolase family 2, partial [Erysipelotrichia bacterium]|nr:glycoside hydrolase family 2 [Erysipelotrichia bacterium]